MYTSDASHSGKPVVNLVASVKAIILSETREFGPSPHTGGHLHKLTDAKAQKVAELIVSSGPQYKLEPAFVAAGLCGESRFDPDAINPNWQDATKGEVAHAAFLHTDLGLAQFDAATLASEPEFKGLSDEAIRAKAMDPEWAVPAFCKFVRALLDATQKEVAADPSLLVNVPDHDVRILATTAYNAGLHGAAHLAHTHGDFSYGVRWMSNYNKYSTLLKG